jgi:DNA-binding NarL/FixJ family response regulator
MRAVLIDDHQLIRDAVSRVLSEQLEFDEVLQAPDLDAGLELLSDVQGVDLIIADLNMPGSAGPESLGALVDGFPDARVVVMSASESKEDVLGCVAAGVDGYVPKALPVPDMVAALRQVMDGTVFLPRALTRRGVEPRARAIRNLAGVEHLTTRQREVLDQLLLGRASKEIARALDVAEGTVKIHLAAIYRALGVRTRAEAISRLMS